MKRVILLTLASLLFLLLVFIYQQSQFSGNSFVIVFCDVGQGDAIFVRSPKGVDILIDAGPKNGKVLTCLSNNMPFWDRKLELVFATHPDADHIGGFIDVLKHYQIDSFNSVSASKDTSVFKDLQEQIRRDEVLYREISKSAKFTTTDGVEISTLWPEKGFSSSDTNEYSLVQILKYREFDVLLTGDVSYQTLNSLSLPRVFEVFKLPHHGSKTGVSDETFKNFGFSLSIISAGKKNRYGHPHKSVIDLLKKYNVKHLRTDFAGEIKIISDGTSWRVVGN